MFTNLSLPLPGEFDLEFGILGAVVAMFLWGRYGAAWTRRGRWARRRRGGLAADLAVAQLDCSADRWARWSRSTPPRCFLSSWPCGETSRRRLLVMLSQRCGDVRRYFVDRDTSETLVPVLPIGVDVGAQGSGNRNVAVDQNPYQSLPA